MDLISVLLRANASENPTNKMTDDEVIHQITCATSFLLEMIWLTHSTNTTSTLLLAGHDTIANTSSWFLWEVAKHPESQGRIRAEIAAFRAKKGEAQPSIADLDNMTYTQAALKVLPTPYHATPSSLTMDLFPSRSR